jgi:dTDP-4-dehydrorhamnose reductase
MLLVLGSTGALGLALQREARKRGLSMRGAARKGADVSLDVTDEAAVRSLIGQLKPTIVINCAALTNLDECESDPVKARRVNADAPLAMATAARHEGAQFVQVSTDQLFTGDGNVQHDEAARVTLVNEYARSKYAGEAAALGVPGTLAVRTNFTGWRGWAQPTFIEWAISAIESREPTAAFTDFYTSTIDAGALAEALLDLATQRAEGLINVASSEVTDKGTFLRELARLLGRPADQLHDCSVRTLKTPRAESLGLDVRKAESALGRRLPGIEEVLTALLRSRPELKCAC